MKPTLAFLLHMYLLADLNGQSIHGRVVDSNTLEPLEYVSMGVLNTRLGTITNEKGEFSLAVNDLSPDSTLRISMIGYKSQTYALGELPDEDMTIQLVIKPVQIAEVTVKPFGEAVEIGTTSFNRIGNWCGWGGSRFGRGNEIGTEVDLGDSPAYIQSLHVHVHRQAYDTSWYRLHIRTLENALPGEELLFENVIVSISEESGWVELDLREYNIVLTGQVALTLEWLKVGKVYADRAMKINGKVTSEYVLFNQKNKKGCILTRWGVEADWTRADTSSPSIYLTVLQ